MKKIVKHIALATLALSVSCADDNYYGIPNLDGENVTLTPTLTLDNLAAKATNLNTIYTIDTDDIIEGYVVSSDEGGNFYKSLSVVNAENTKGMSIALDATGLFARYEPGRKIYVKLNGLNFENATSYTNGLNVGIEYEASNGPRIGRIDNIYINNHVQRGAEKINEDLLVKKLTIGQAKDDKYLNQLIEIEGVQFAEKSLGKTYFDTDLKTYDAATAVDHDLTDSKENTLIVRVSEYANFAGNPVAVGSGKIRGVLTKYNSGYQFMVRTLNDIKFDQPRFEYDIPEPPATTNLPFLGADFEDWQAFLDSAGYLNATSTSPFVPSAIVKERPGLGIDNSNALGIEGTTTKNEAIFIVRSTGTNLPQNPTKLSFWVKGTAAKSLNIYVYMPDGGNYAFNVQELTDDKSLQSAGTGSNSNKYTGVIDTNNEWVFVQLDLAGLNINTDPTKNLFAMRIGNNAQYNLLIDNFSIE